MRVHVADHPLITHKLTVLRDKNTPSPTFRALTEELVTLLAYEATRDVRVDPVDIETPVAPTTGLAISQPRPLVVPILRAGLGMLEGMAKLVPTAEVGFLGMVRDEETLQPTTYAERLPDDLSNRQCFVLDPMLATGGSLIAAIDYLLDRGAVDVTAVCLLAAPEGLAAVEAAMRGTRRHASSSAPSTRSSTRTATSSPASATRATASTAWPDATRSPPEPAAPDPVTPCGVRTDRARRRLALTHGDALLQTRDMTDSVFTPTSFEALGSAGTMMPMHAVMCRMCA